MTTPNNMAKETTMSYDFQARIREDKDILRISEAEADQKWSSMSERGLPTAFREGELITFSDGLVKAIPFKTSNGKTAYTGHILAGSKRQGGVFLCPISIFRRSPVVEERELLYVPENSFGVTLLSSQTDLERARKLSSHVIKVVKVLQLHRYNFSEGAVDYAPENYKPLVAYLFQLVQ